MTPSSPEPHITVPDYARVVVDRLESRGYEAYVVGGCVRDSLMGRVPNDWDVCTNALPEDVLRVFRRFHVIKTGLQHGTVTVMSDRQPVEVTTFRVDGQYSDNRHPDAVSFVSRVEEDLARRDFTINAMAYSPTRGLVDAYGGQEDLAAGLIRCVGEPDARFNEDGLRILRALRFAARFGFGIERETAYAVHRNRFLLENVSAERIFKELKGILVGSGVADMLQAFPDVFSCIIPELAPSVGFDQKNPYHCYDVWTHSVFAVQAAPQDEVLRLSLLLHDIGKPECFSLGEDGRGHFYGHPELSARLAKQVLLRLKCDNATLDAVTTLVREHDATFPTTVAGMRRLIGRLGEQNVRRLFEVQRADHAAHSDFDRASGEKALRDARELFEDVLEMDAAFTVKDLAINGHHLMQLGMRPGPAMKRILHTLLEEVQEDVLSNDTDSLSARAQSLLWGKGE